MPVGDVRIGRGVPPVWHRYARLLPAPLLTAHRTLLHPLLPLTHFVVSPRPLRVGRRVDAVERCSCAHPLAARGEVGRGHNIELAPHQLHPQAHPLHARTAHERRQPLRIDACGEGQQSLADGAADLSDRLGVHRLGERLARPRRAERRGGEGLARGSHAWWHYRYLRVPRRRGYKLRLHLGYRR